MLASESFSRVAATGGRDISEYLVLSFNVFPYSCRAAHLAFLDRRLLRYKVLEEAENPQL